MPPVTEKNEMTFVPTAAAIDLRSWEFFETDDPTGGLRDVLMTGFAARATTVMRETFDEDPPRLMFPFGWAPKDDGFNGPAPTDPVAIYVVLPLGPHSDESVCYACSLEGVVDDLIDMHVSGSSDKIEDREGKEICAQIAARLRELADKLDAVCSGEG